MKQEFDQLITDLKNGRGKIEQSMVDCDESQVRTTDLLQRISDLRRRSAQTDQAFERMQPKQK